MNRTARRPLPQALLLAALCLAAHGVAAQEAAMPYIDQATGLRFPNKLGALGYQRMVTYGDDKLGYCVLYASPESRAQVCVYDLGYKNVPTGIDSAPFREALRIAVEGTLASTNQPPYRNGVLLAEGAPSVKVDGKAARAEMRMFTSELSEIDGSIAAQRHLILMTAGFGRILKLNYSSSRDSGSFLSESREIVYGFVGVNSDIMRTLLVHAPAAP